MIKSLKEGVFYEEAIRFYFRGINAFCIIFLSCQFQKQPVKATLSFNERFVNCKLVNGQIPLNSGVEVADGTQLVFTVSSLPEGKVVKEWTINGKPVSASKVYNCYFTLKLLK